MLQYFILDENRQPKPATLLAWARWFEKDPADRVIVKTTIVDVDVSTVFLGIDHSYELGGPPLLYETLVFGGPMDGQMMRYSTEAQARQGHTHLVQEVAAKQFGLGAPVPR